MQRTQPIFAGIVAALVGFTSSSAVVIAGLRAVGATEAQAGSGLVALCLLQGVGIIWLSFKHRIPVTLAWSTPGAALLAGTVAVDGGWAAAVGAFLITGVLVVLTGLWKGLADLITRIPASLAQAMLAGVLLPLCLQPVTALVEQPLMVAPVVVVWLALMRFAPRWAVPVAFAVALITVVLAVVFNGQVVDALLPAFSLTLPSFTVGALLGVALPLYLVTMAAQNVPGVAVMRSYGYSVPWRETMVVTGGGTMLGAFAGGHAINLAAISAALAAGPEAGDVKRRWLAGVSCGFSYLVLAAGATALTSLVAAAPPGVIEAVAGLALLGAFGGALKAALTQGGEQLQAIVTLLVAASGVAVFGIGAAFWSLIAGLLVHAVLKNH